MPKVTLSDPIGFLSDYGVELIDTSKESEKLCLCPFHDDTTPSCQVNIDKQVFICPSCPNGMKGDLIDLAAGRMGVKRSTIMEHIEQLTGTPEAPIDASLVISWHNVLLGNKSTLDMLSDRKGINARTVQDFMLGWDPKLERITIPIRDSSGILQNVRKWSPTDRKKKVINLKGRGERRLFPIGTLTSDTVIIAEGEFKALLLIQLGYPGIAPTGGARAWNPSWNRLFKDKIVYLMYDIDDAGTSGAQRVARNLYGIAKSVRIVKLPIDIKAFPTGDITDFIVKMEMGKSDVQNAIDAAVEWTPAPLQVGMCDEGEVIPLHLAQTSEAKFYHKLVSFDSVVSAKDTAPFIIPKTCVIQCTKDRDYCAICPVHNAAETEDPKLEITNTHPAILKLVDVPSDKLAQALKSIAGVPSRCEVCRFNIETTQNVEELRLIPSVKIRIDDKHPHVVRRAFYVGHGLDSNATYSFTARVVPEPKSQYATLLAYKAEASLDSLANFKLEDPARFTIFRPEAWTMAGLVQRMDQLYSDLEANVTRIYRRRDLHLLYDLVYHSLLYLPFQGRQIRGWCEGLVLGDSGQGKSACLSALMQHYQVGEKIDSKGVSAAGLVGGLQENAKRWFVTWGAIPLNDRRLVALEEVKGMPIEVIARMTEMRSSGKASLSKIEKAETHARTRLLWISNPRSDQQLGSYNYGVYALKELIGSLEDIRRFDLAIMVSSGDVPKDLLNMRDADRPSAPPVHTPDLCRDLILWAWSRTSDQVIIEPDAVEAILRASDIMGEKYVSNIPLVEAADQRLKLARLSAAMAARTFSATPDGLCVIVRKCHVEFVHDYLDRIYSSRAFGYAEYSKLIKSENTMQDPADVEAMLRGLPNAKDVIRNLLEWSQFSLTDWIDVTEHDKDEARMAVGMLVRKNAIRKGRGGMYVKLPAFITMLRNLEQEGNLETADRATLTTRTGI